MATYTIVNSTTDPLGPGEIAAGGTIQVAEGDVFIIGPSANANTTFTAAGGAPANFDIVVDDCNANGVGLKFSSDLTPTVTVADDVNEANLAIDAKGTSAINLVAGDNVQLGKYEGSDVGTDTIITGDGFSTAHEWKTSGGNDVVVIGDNATFVGELGTGDGDDTITIGSGYSASGIDGGAGNDTLTTQTSGGTVQRCRNHEGGLLCSRHID